MLWVAIRLGVGLVLQDSVDVVQLSHDRDPSMGM